jgi:hypothetical protein
MIAKLRKEMTARSHVLPDLDAFMQGHLREIPPFPGCVPAAT